MKIKASLFMPILATLTVVAIVCTGIALGQLHHGAPWVTLLGSMRRVEAAAAVDRVTLADSDPLGAELGVDSGRAYQPIVQPASSIESVQAGVRPAVLDERPGTSAVTLGMHVSKDSPDPGVNAGASDPELSAGGPLATREARPKTENGPDIAASDADPLQDPAGPTNSRSQEAPKVEATATQLVAASFGHETESAPIGAQEDGTETSHIAEVD